MKWLNYAFSFLEVSMCVFVSAISFLCWLVKEKVVRASGFSIYQCKMCLKVKIQKQEIVINFMICSVKSLNYVIKKLIVKSTLKKMILKSILMQLNLKLLIIMLIIIIILSIMLIIIIILSIMLIIIIIILLIMLIIIS